MRRLTSVSLLLLPHRHFLALAPDLRSLAIDKRSPLSIPASLPSPAPDVSALSNFLFNISSEKRICMKIAVSFVAVDFLEGCKLLLKVLRWLPCFVLGTEAVSSHSSNGSSPIVSMINHIIDNVLHPLWLGYFFIFLMRFPFVSHVCRRCCGSRLMDVSDFCS